MTEKECIKILSALDGESRQPSDEELQRAAADPTFGQVIDEASQLRRALQEREPQPDAAQTEKAWQQFAALHARELEALPDGEPMRRVFRLPVAPLRKVAAVMLTAMMLTGMAFAAIRVARHFSDSTRGAGDAAADTVETARTYPANVPDSVPTPDVVPEPMVFDNVTLESILSQIAAHYGARVEWRSSSVGRLRLHFVWHPEDGLQRTVEKLNRFESLHVTLEGETLTVE